MSDRSERLGETNYWDELIALRNEQRERQKTAIQVIRGDELPIEKNSLGHLQWYMHPHIKDTVLSTFLFYRQTLPPGGRSGRLKYQGGNVIYILEGEGYTILDGVRHAWSAGDIINVPLKTRGVVIQHFNSSKEKNVQFVAVEPNWFNCVGVDRGCGFEVLEAAPRAVE